jgi:hypothetical protein
VQLVEVNFLGVDREGSGGCGEKCGEGFEMRGLERVRHETVEEKKKEGRGTREEGRDRSRSARRTHVSLVEGDFHEVFDRAGLRGLVEEHCAEGIWAVAVLGRERTLGKLDYSRTTGREGRRRRSSLHGQLGTLRG